MSIDTLRDLIPAYGKDISLNLGSLASVALSAIGFISWVGVLVPVAQASDAPIKLIGVGEGIEDLQPFDAQAFSRSLVGLED